MYIKRLYIYVCVFATSQIVFLLTQKKKNNMKKIIENMITTTCNAELFELNCEMHRI